MSNNEQFSYDDIHRRICALRVRRNVAGRYMPTPKQWCKLMMGQSEPVHEFLTDFIAAQQRLKDETT